MGANVSGAIAMSPATTAAIQDPSKAGQKNESVEREIIATRIALQLSPA